MTMIHPNGAEQFSSVQRPEFTPELQIEAQMMNAMVDLAALVGPEGVVRTGTMIDMKGEETYSQCLAMAHEDGYPWLTYTEDMIIGNDEPTARRITLYSTSEHPTVHVYMSEDNLPPVIATESYKRGQTRFHPIDFDNSARREATLELVRDAAVDAVETYDHLDEAKCHRLALRALMLAA